MQEWAAVLAKSFGPEFHTSYGGGKRAMAEVLSDRFRVPAEQAQGWIDDLETSHVITWHPDDEAGLSDQAGLLAARTGLPATPLADGDGYWELA